MNDRDSVPPSVPPRSEPRPSTSPPGDRPLTPVGAIGWTLFSVLAALIVVDLSQLARPGRSPELVGYQIGFSLAFGIVTYAILRVHLPARSLHDALGVRPSHPAVYLLAMLVGVGLQVPATLLSNAVHTAFPRSPEELAHLAQLYSFSGQFHRAAFAFAAILLGPVSEELLVRGALFRALGPYRSRASLVVTTAISFTLLHLAELRGYPEFFTSGLLLGYLRSQTGSLAAPLLAHASFNGTIVFAMLLGKVTLDEQITPLSAPVVAGGLTLLLASLAGIHLLSRSSDVVQEARGEDLQ